MQLSLQDNNKDPKISEAVKRSLMEIDSSDKEEEDDDLVVSAKCNACKKIYEKKARYAWHAINTCDSCEKLLFG